MQDVDPYCHSQTDCGRKRNLYAICGDKLHMKLDTLAETAKQSSKHGRLHPKLMEKRLVDRMVGGFCHVRTAESSLIFLIFDIIPHPNARK